MPTEITAPNYREYSQILIRIGIPCAVPVNELPRKTEDSR